MPEISESPSLVPSTNTKPVTAYLALWLLNKKTIGGCVRSSQGLSDIFKQGGNYSWVHLRSSHEEAQEVYWEVLLDRQRLSALQFADDFANSIFGWSVAQRAQWDATLEPQDQLASGAEELLVDDGDGVVGGAGGGGRGGARSQTVLVKRPKTAPPSPRPTPTTMPTPI